MHPFRGSAHASAWRSARQKFLAMRLAGLALLVAMVGSGCVYGLDYEGAPGEDSPDFGKISCADAAMRLISIDGHEVEYPGLGPIKIGGGGFSVRVKPGVHVLFCRYQPSNPDSHLPGEPKHLDFGPSQVITLSVPANTEVKLRPVEVGGRRWEIVVEAADTIERQTTASSSGTAARAHARTHD